VSARLVWMVPLILFVLGLEYHAIVRWEEQLLTARLGDAYREYTARVPRWLPMYTAIKPASSPAAYSWRATLFSERGTLVAIAAGYLLLYAKSHI